MIKNQIALGLKGAREIRKNRKGDLSVVTVGECVQEAQRLLKENNLQEETWRLPDLAENIWEFIKTVG